MHDLSGEKQGPLIEVLEVRQLDLRDQPLWGRSLDIPRPDTKSESRSIALAGWVLSKDTPAVAVEVVYHDGVINVTPVGDPRRDVAAKYPDVPGSDRSGFRAVIGVTGLTPEFELEVRAVLGDDSRVPIASVRARYEALQVTAQPRLRPIVLTGMPRSGTTWLMRLFASHPDVVVYGRYPYEGSTAKYWAYTFDLLSQPGSILQPSIPKPFSYDIWNVGHGLFTRDRKQARTDEWFGVSYIRRLASFSQQTVDDWYAAVADSQDKDGAQCFAEKFWPDHLPLVMRELYPEVKEVFIVRDFRDTVFSTLAFEERMPWPATVATRLLRGEQAMRRTERAHPKPVEDYIRQDLKGAALGFARSWRSRSSRAHLVRYEDMVYEPEKTLTALLGYLELEASPEILDHMLTDASEETAASDGHRTSPNLDESIGRWKREADESLQAVCQEAFGDLLEEFGYSVTQSSVASREAKSS